MEPASLTWGGAAALYAGAGCVLWVVFYAMVGLGMRRLGQLPREVAPGGPLPALSVVLSARDEAGTIGPALESLLRQDYPGLEVVAVDDRSTDGTGEVIAALAGRDARLKAVRVDELPAGWMGKVHGLHRGAERATGQWVLFTDADVQFEPGVLARAVAHAEAEGLDHLAMLPLVSYVGFWFEVALHAFGMLFFLGTGALGFPGRERVVGVGAFNMVRRRVFDRTPGFEWIRMEVTDDLGLALMMKAAGGRGGFLLAGDQVRVEWYPSISAMIRGLEKNMFGTMARYSYLRAAVASFLLTVFALAPLAATGMAALGGAGWLWWCVVPVWGALAAGGLYGRGALKAHALPVVCAPLGYLIIALTLLNSAHKCHAQGGVRWRETFYPLAELRAAQRMRL